MGLFRGTLIRKDEIDLSKAIAPGWRLKAVIEREPFIEKPFVTCLHIEFFYPGQEERMGLIAEKKAGRKVFKVMSIYPEDGFPNMGFKDKRTTLPAFVKLMPFVIDYVKARGFYGLHGVTNEGMARILEKRFGAHTAAYVNKDGTPDRFVRKVSMDFSLTPKNKPNSGRRRK